MTDYTAVWMPDGAVAMLREHIERLSSKDVITPDEDATIIELRNLVRSVDAPDGYDQQRRVPGATSVRSDPQRETREQTRPSGDCIVT